jgi:hypothetical protein
MVFGGHFKTKGRYHHGSQMKGAKKNPFEVKKFSCAAISDEYVAIGTGDKILIFGKDGEWFMVHKEKATSIHHLFFSPDGTELLAIVTTATAGVSRQRVLIAPTNSFPGPTLERNNSVFTEVVDWGRCNQFPSGAAFSSDGNRIAIYTSCDSYGLSQIRLLERHDSKSLWRSLGESDIQINGQSPGEVTGIQLCLLVINKQSNSPVSVKISSFR